MWDVNDLKRINDEKVRQEILRTHAEIAQTEVELIQQGWLDDTQTLRNRQSELAVLKSLSHRKPN